MATATPVGAAVIYSALGLLAGPQPQLASVAGWGMVVAALTTGAFLPTGTKPASAPGQPTLVKAAPRPTKPIGAYVPAGVSNAGTTSNYARPPIAGHFN